MASAQQKPKLNKDSGTRNSTRRSGKAYKKVTLPTRADNQPASGRGKPSGKSYKGVSIARIAAQASSRGVSVTQIKSELDANVSAKRKARRGVSKAQRTDRHAARMAHGDKPAPRSVQSKTSNPPIIPPKGKSQLSGPFPYTGD